MDEYDHWNFRKKSLSHTHKKPFFKEGEVWWCSIGINLGTEAKGKGEMFTRPVLIIKKLSSEACIVLPITTQENTGMDHVASNQNDAHQKISKEIVSDGKVSTSEDKEKTQAIA